MGNNRPAIREALKTILSGNTSAGTNVYTNRKNGLWESELPAILIYTNQEQAVPESLSASRYKRTVLFSIEVRLQGDDTVDDDIDNLLASIEDLIKADQSIGGTVLTTYLTNSEISTHPDAEKNIGVGVLSFESLYIS